MKKYEDESMKFFTNMDTFKPNERTHKLFKFIKNYRKNCQKPSTNYIPIQKWNDTLNSINGTKPQLINDIDHCPILPPPHLMKLLTSSERQKPGKLPELTQ
jgi:hypothetical protein